MPSWAVYVALALGWAAGYGGYWLAEKISPRESRCDRCGRPVPPGRDLCGDCIDDVGL